MCRSSWNLGASTSWNLQGLSRDCCTCSPRFQNKSPCFRPLWIGMHQTGEGLRLDTTVFFNISNSGFLRTLTEEKYQVILHLIAEPTTMASWPRAAWRLTRRQSVRNTAHNVYFLCCHLYRVYLAGILLVVREYRYSAAQWYKTLLLLVSLQCSVTLFFCYGNLRKKEIL